MTYEAQLRRNTITQVIFIRALNALMVSCPVININWASSQVTLTFRGWFMCHQSEKRLKLALIIKVLGTG